MAGPYQIPWQPLDINPGASFIAGILNQNRANERADEHLEFQREAHRQNMERESSERVRQREADDYKRRVEAWNAMPMLQRAAARSIGMANANPYGVKFEEETQAPPSIANVDIMKAAGNQFGQHAQQQLAAPLPQPDGEQEFYGPEEPPAPVAEGPEPPSGIDEAQAILDAPRGRRMFANFQGQRFEVPDSPQTSGFGEKYDAIYQRALQEPGVTPEEAYRFVAKMAHDDTAEESRNQRAADAEAGRDRRFAGYHMDIAQQFERQRRQLEQSDINSRRAAAAAGGVVRSPALQDFVAAANALKPGEPIPPTVADLGLRAGFKPNQIAAEADRYRNSDTKSLKGGAGGSGVLGLKEIAPLNTSIDNIDKLISQIESNPQAWNEYRDNSLSWKRGEGLRDTTIGKALQAGRVMDVSPEQGLRSNEAKTLHQRQERLNTDIAKSFGGVITEGDRAAAASNQANFALDASQKIAQLREMRDSLVSKRNVFTQSRAAGAAGPAKPSAAVKTLRMPDGSIQRFDASGKRVE